MKISVISDLHMGRGDRTDRFGHEGPQFHSFLDHLESISDQVVLLGDILDTHHGRIPLAFFREVRIVCDLHRGITDRLLGGRYRLVAGNHDSCLTELPGVTSEFLLESGGSRLLFMHGHQFDRLISLSPTLCALANFLGGAAQRHGMDGALDFLDWVDDKANGMTEDRSTLYRTHALRRARAEGVSGIVMGHTHRQDFHAANGVSYLNVGACLEGRFEYGLIDLDSGTMEPLTWEP